MTDVSNCVASLKKVVQEMQSIATGEQLQMAQPAARYVSSGRSLLHEFHRFRPSAVTLTKDPGAAYLIDFDALVAVSICILGAHSIIKFLEGLGRIP
jgi:hypothetical protein